MAVPSDGSYDIPEGIICGYPVTCSGGGYEIVPDLEINDFSRKRIDASVAELQEERESVEKQGLLS
jgi:malate dehydrogenase